MKKMPRRGRGSQPEFASARPASSAETSLTSVLSDVREDLRALIVRSGLDVFRIMLENERSALCGPRSQPSDDRTAYRHGHDRGELVFGGQKVVVKKPRVRSVDGQSEVPLPLWERMSRLDPLGDRVMEQMLVGVSTRNYQRSLEPVPSSLRARGATRSAVSRHFVARTRAQVESFLSRRLVGESYPVLMIDGKGFGDHLLIVVLGITADGRKQVLGIAEGSTENSALCRRLLSDLVERGLAIEESRLVVIDGGKGLRKAVREVFGKWAVVQRCQVHKLRNVLEHLPKDQQGWARTAIVAAYGCPDAKKATEMLKRLATRLEEKHPGAAASLREGLEETLTVTALGLKDALWRTLRSTNPIENVQGTLEGKSKNVKRWRSGSMAIRWAVTAALEAQKKFRRIRGHQQMPQLIEALKRSTNARELDNEKAAA
jgi:putative transposase